MRYEIMDNGAAGQGKDLLRVNRDEAKELTARQIRSTSQWQIRTIQTQRGDLFKEVGYCGCVTLVSGVRLLWKVESSCKLSDEFLLACLGSN